MSGHMRKHLLEVRLEGKAVESGRIPLDLAISLLEQLNKAFLRTAMVLRGQMDSTRPGRRPRRLKDMISLALVSVSHGSPDTVLGFERTPAPRSLPGMDEGLPTFESAIAGLSTVQETSEALPAGFDRGVLMVWRDAGKLFNQGIQRIQLSLNHRTDPLVAVYTKAGRQHMQSLIVGPCSNARTVEGRLLMADFKEHGRRCRVHPPIGEPVLCLFDDTQRDEVLENILHYVKVVGEAVEDPVTGRIASIKLADIQRLEEREEEQAELLPSGEPLPIGFWSSPTIEELAAAQGVSPVTDIRKLFGTWPGKPDDGFEEVIVELRHGSAGKSRP